MIYPGDHHQDKNSTANNPGLFPRKVAQREMKQRRWQQSFLFSISVSNVCRLYLLQMASPMLFSPCDLPPPPILNHKKIYSVLREVKINIHTTYLIYSIHLWGPIKTSPAVYGFGHILPANEMQTYIP